MQSSDAWLTSLIASRLEVCNNDHIMLCPYCSLWYSYTWAFSMGSGFILLNYIIAPGQIWAYPVSLHPAGSEGINIHPWFDRIGQQLQGTGSIKMIWYDMTYIFLPTILQNVQLNCFDTRILPPWFLTPPYSIHVTERISW